MSGSDHGIVVTIDVGGDDGRSVEFAVSGDFDATQVERFEQALEALPHDAAMVVVDIGDCTILDSAALGALVCLRHRLDATDAELELRADKPFQRLILANTGLGDYLGLAV